MSILENVKKLPEKFLYTSVIEDKGVLYALGYDLDKDEKILYSTRRLDGLGYYIVDSTGQSDIKTFVSEIPVKKYYCNTINQLKQAYWDKSMEGHIHGSKNVVSHFINNECVPRMEKDIDSYIKYADERMNIGYIDIETKIGESFPTPYEAEYNITAVTLYCSRSKVFYIFADNEVSEEGVQKLKKELHELKKSKYTIHKDATIDLRCFDDEKNMLFDMAKVISEEEVVDVLVGWNSGGFDIPYIYFRFKRLFGPNGPNMLSPIGKSREYYSSKKKKFILDIKGINLIDALNWYKDFTKNIKILRSYSLDYVCNYEMGLHKHQLPGTLKETYENYYDEFIKYNFLDTARVVQLMEYKKFFLLAYVICYKYYTIQLEKIFSPVIGWENIMLKETMKINRVFPYRKKTGTSLKYPGAFVKEVVPGFYKNIVSFDVNSEYPHIQRSWFISPETHITDDNLILNLYKNDAQCKKIIDLRNSAPDHMSTEQQCIWWDENILIPLIKGQIDISFLNLRDDICMTPTFEFFWKNPDAIAPKMLKSIYSDRKKLTAVEDNLKIKAEEIKNSDPKLSKQYSYDASIKKIEQMALKIVINAEYGAFASGYFHFHNMRIARAIILTGRYLIQATGMGVTDYYNKFIDETFKENNITPCNSWIYSDTDSVAGDSVINVNGKDIDIKSFVDNYDENKTYTTPSVNKDTGCVEHNKVTYVWKNNVKKRMFKIKTKDREVIVTADHSIIVERDGKIQSIKPADIDKKTDKIIQIEKP